VSIGQNASQVQPVVQRIESDDPLTKEALKTLDEAAAKKFVVGGDVVDKVADKEVIRYVYLSRGEWMIKKFQGYMDRLRLPIARERRDDLTESYVELNRTFAFLCLLRATDDGSEKAKVGIAEAVAAHREAISRLKLVFGPSISQATTEIIREYIDVTFMTNLDVDTLRIPAGTYSSARYKTFEQTYVSGASHESK